MYTSDDIFSDSHRAHYDSTAQLARLLAEALGESEFRAPSRAMIDIPEPPSERDPPAFDQ